MVSSLVIRQVTTTSQFLIILNPLVTSQINKMEKLNRDNPKVRGKILMLTKRLLMNLISLMTCLLKRSKNFKLVTRKIKKFEIKLGRKWNKRLGEKRKKKPEKKKQRKLRLRDNKRSSKKLVCSNYGMKMT